MVLSILFIHILGKIADAASASSTQIVAVNGVSVRVQALSSTLVRVELALPDGSFEDRATFTARNRSSFAGVPLTVDPSQPTLLKTAGWSLELGGALPPHAGAITTTCAAPMRGWKPTGKAPIVGVVATADAANKCCAACDANVGCTAWQFDQDIHAKPTGGSGLRMSTCKSDALGQQWAGIDADGAISAISSLASPKDKKPGCWQIPNCATKPGQKIIAGEGCKAVPKPGAGGCAANEAFQFHKANSSFTSTMDHLCVTKVVDTIEQQICGDPIYSTPGLQAWALTPVAGKHGVFTISLAGKPQQCLDDTPAPPKPGPPQMTNCTLFASVVAITSGGSGTTLGGAHPGTSAGGAPSAGGVAVTIRRTKDNALVWWSPAFGAVPAALDAPGPALAQPSLTAAWAIADSPRFVPPPQGAAPPPNLRLAVDAAGVSPAAPFPATSGFDVGVNSPDAYIFLLDNGMTKSRAEFVKLTGRIPILPNWAFGLWFCWYHPYTQAEKHGEMQTFLDLKLGLTVASLDRDWRDEATLLDGSFPYVLNTTLLPDFTALASFAHSNGIRFFFNDHPKYLDTGNGTGSGSAIATEVLSPAEIAFRYNGQVSMMKKGLDFWWNDCHWKWENPSLEIPNASIAVDARTWGGAVFYDVMNAYRNSLLPTLLNAKEETVISLGCSGSPHPASHRYPTQWTGDIFSNQLGAQVAYMVDAGVRWLTAYTHPDCTGHHNADTPEVYVRWIQFCALGTIFRVHSDPFNDRRPWKQGEDANTTVVPIFRAFAQMRSALLPSIASAAAQASLDGTPLVRRCDFAFPTQVEASRSDQYLFAGDETLVAPVDPWGKGTGATPIPKDNWNRSRTVWVPPGEWSDAWSGKVLTGPITVLRSAVPVNQSLVFHRHGGVVVTARASSFSRGGYENVIIEDINQIDFRDGLVLHARPLHNRESKRSSNSNAGNDRAAAAPRKITWRDATTRAPRVHSTHFALDSFAEDCVSSSSSSSSSSSHYQQHRCIRLTVEAEQRAEEAAGGGAAASGFARRWLARVYLAPGERVLGVAEVVEGDTASSFSRDWSVVREGTAAIPFRHGGQGEYGGAVVEIELPRAAAMRALEVRVAR